uniref:long-chain-fatty-acid--CoA ligase n=1 Tax=Clastoptera arizonana TaxID=38151 RepID=A0A1B6E357_9HEMI
MSTALVNGIQEENLNNSNNYKTELKSNVYIKTGINNNDNFVEEEKKSDISENIKRLQAERNEKVEIPLKEDVSYENGPDQILPSTNIWTSEADGCVQIDIGQSPQQSKIPVSIPGLLHSTATNYPNHTALSYKKDNIWKNITYKEYEEQVRIVAKAFIALGLERYHGVGIIGFNSTEWFLSNLGAIFAGGVSVGMYTTNSPEACQHCLEGSKSNICIVEDSKQLDKILAIKDSLPHLKTIIQYSGATTASGVLTWDEVIKVGQQQTDEELNLRLKKIAINQCSTLIYTSGTEGKSKAVMLSHDNLTWDAKCAGEYLEVEQGKESIVSFLPLSHVAAQLADIYIPITFAAKVAFADKDALKGSLVKTLGEIRPTVFLGVPRVWEKIYEKMTAIGKETTGLKKMIATWGKSSCLQHHLNVMNGNNSETYGYKFYRWMVFSRVKAAIGLDKCKVFLSAAAPIDVEIKKYFMSIDIPLTEAFGMSESTGAHVISKSNDFHLDTLGRPIPGVETKLDKKNEEGQGEICMKGRHVFMGYLNEPEKTKAAIDSERWLHSGDVGTLDSNNHLKITGRIKELLITAGGENIAPVLIEQILKQELPCISNAQLIGDRRKFLSMLLTLKTEVDPETTEPLDELTKEVKVWCKHLGCEVNSVKDILDGPKSEIMSAIQAGIDRTNAKAISNAQKIQKFAILPADFSVPTGELGPTLKLKRNVVYDKYKDIIENFYKE